MTDRYAVIGNPIAHSKSPMIHGAFAQATVQDIEYIRIEGADATFNAQVDEFRKTGGLGMNVTAPFKLRAFEIATDRSERAQSAGAVNAMKFESGRIYAENFDGIGLTNDIQRNLGFPMAGRRILMLGAGGAARGALSTFLEQGPATLLVINRTQEKAQRLAREFSACGAVSAGTIGDLESLEFDIVINATSASLNGELPSIPPGAFADGSLAYELVYGKGLTPFLRLAQSAGAMQIADGVGMLVEQAAEAFEWWRGVRPDTKALIRQMTVPLV